MPFLLEALLWVVGIYGGLGLLTHVSARLGWHKKVVPVKIQDLSGTRIWGKANPWRIVIHSGLTPEQKKSVLAHEWSHVRDNWLTGFIGLSLWKLVRKRDATLWTESRAYAESVKNGRSLDDSARALSSKTYKLGITKEKAKRAIEEYL